MIEKTKIYKCDICGYMLETSKQEAAEYICCGEPMKELEEKTADPAIEKHVPFITREKKKYVVKVGQNAAHPMEEKHYIMWIELIVDGVVYRENLKPGDAPQAKFKVPEGKDVYARELCSVHGLWSSK